MPPSKYRSKVQYTTVQLFRFADIRKITLRTHPCQTKDDKVENIKKDSEFQDSLEFNKDMMFLVIHLRPPQVWQNVVIGGWKIINVDTKNNKVTLVGRFCSV